MCVAEPLFDELAELPNEDHDDITALADGLELNNSFPFIKTLWSDSKSVTNLVTKLCDEIKEYNGFKRFNETSYRNNLTPLMGNLVRARAFDNMWVAYSCSPRGYTTPKRYNPCKVTELLKDVIVKTLVELGYVRNRKGFHVRNPKRDNKESKSRRSRMQATDKLVSLWSEHGVHYKNFTTNPDEEIIILKSEKDTEGRAEIINYEDTRETTKLRANLQVINENIAGARVELNMPQGSIQALQEMMKDEAEGDYIPTLDFSRIKLKRIFNNESFDCGGRFYHGWWMEIPSEYREHIRINGLPTAEIDYSAIHPRLLYSMAGVQAPSDPYEIEGYSSDYRAAIKKAVLVIINAQNRSKAIGSLIGELPKLHPELKTKKIIERLLDAIEKTHKPIANYFNSNFGVVLQRIDSQVAEQVMLRLHEGAATFPIVALPVHDSFIVPFYAKELTKRIMEEEFQKLTEQQGIVEAKEDELSKRINRIILKSKLTIPNRSSLESR